MRPRGRPYADLHLHTTASDGQLRLAEVPHAARRAGVRAVAVTDHDRLHPGLEEPITRRYGVTVIRGIELRVDADGTPVDLLGYAVEATPALEAELARLQRDREDRGRRIVERVEAHLDLDLGVAPRPGLGRPHIARAIAAHPDADYDYAGAFANLIGDGRPCYVARAVPTFDRGRGLLGDACGLVGLAHPLKYDDPADALALCADLDAVERWYPYDAPVDQTPVDAAIDAHGLVPTGGSDAHDDRLGVAGLDPRAYRRVSRRLRVGRG